MLLPSGNRLPKESAINGRELLQRRRRLLDERPSHQGMKFLRRRRVLSPTLGQALGRLLAFRFGTIRQGKPSGEHRVAVRSPYLQGANPTVEHALDQAPFLREAFRLLGILS